MDTKKLRQKILDLAIRGKLVPQDPNDEPASVLLERIRAEKERLIKEGKIKRSKKSASDTPHYENRQVGETNEVPFEVPKGWVWTRLCDITELIEDCPHSTAKDEGSGFPLIRTPNVGEGYLLLDGVHRVSESVYNKRNARAIPEANDIIYAREAPAGNAAVIKDNEKVCLGQRTVLIRPLKDFIDSKLLAYFIISPCSKSSLISTAVGSTATHVNLENIRPFTLPLPPITEQHRIATAVDKWFSLIKELEQEKEDLQTSIAQAKSKILDLAIHGKLVPQDPHDEPAIELLKRINPKFTPCDNAHCLYGFPISWELAKLEDVCEFIRNGVSIRQIKGANGIPITRIETISNGVVEREKMGYADIEDDTYEKYYLQNGDILMSHINSPIHVGKSALYESIDGEKIIHGMNLLCLRMKDGIYPKYMNHLFKSDFFRDKIRPYIKNAVNQASINTRSLGGVYTPIPSYNEQLRIVAKIEELFAVLDEIQKSIEA